MTPLIVLDSLQFPSVLFELGGWPSCICVAGQSCYASKRLARSWAWWGPFPCEPSLPFANGLLAAWRVSIASIFEGVITMPTLIRIRLENGNYGLSFSHLSVVLEKWGASKRNRTITWDVNCLFREIEKYSLNHSIDSNSFCNYMTMIIIQTYIMTFVLTTLSVYIVSGIAV